MWFDKRLGRLNVTLVTARRVRLGKPNNPPLATIVCEVLKSAIQGNRDRRDLTCLWVQAGIV